MFGESVGLDICCFGGIV